MKTNKPINEVKNSPYSSLVRSEENKSALFETIIYSLVALSVVIAILQFAEQPVLFGR